MRADECIIDPPSVTAILGAAPDPRQRRGRRYAWGTLLQVIGAAVVSGQQTGAAIAQWVQEHAAEWQQWAPTTCGRVPSAATIRRTLRRVDVAALETALGAWSAAQLCAPAGPEMAALRAVALDGKAVRGAHTHGAKVHLVSLVTHHEALTLAQCAVAEKSNEIPAAHALLGYRDLHGWIVTADAMHTQRSTADVILRQGGHYLLVVKENQPTLYATLAEWFATPAIPAEAETVTETWDKAHGRLEQRMTQVRHLLPCGRVDWLGFPGARQGLARDCWTRRLRAGTEHAARTYALTSLPPEQTTAATLEALWRGHWHIENQAHYVRDVTCREDAGQAWVGQTPQALAALRNSALALFRLAGWTNMAAAFRHVAVSSARAFSLLDGSSAHPLRL